MIPTSRDALALFADDALSGRAALVTGGGSGIGRATALLLNRLGVDVCIVGRTQDTLEATAALATRPLRTLTADLREPDQVDEMLDQVDGLDYLLNNAGGQFVSPAENISHKGFRAVTRLNLDAPWYLTTQVANRFFLPQSYGKVVSITMTPHRGMPGMAHSSAARAAVEMLTRTWASEWGPAGIRTVALAPGIVHTEAWQRYGLNPADVSAFLPGRRLQTADEVAALVAFLFSPAGDYITGTTITADGGFDVAGPAALG